MINEKLIATGELQIILRDANGNIKQNTTVPNMVVSGGKTMIASRLVGTATNIMSHMAIGTGTTEPAANQWKLIAEGDRETLTQTQSTNTVTYSATFGPDTDIAVTEAGIFNIGTIPVADGNMLARTKFLVVNKAAADTLTINWTITIN